MRLFAGVLEAGAIGACVCKLVELVGRAMEGVGSINES